MKERPIFFRGEMVRAILDGRKTQTRRIVKLPHQNPLGTWEPTTVGGEDGGKTAAGHTIPMQGAIWHTRTGDSLLCPQGFPGDRLWIRETWAVGHGYDGVSPRFIPDLPFQKRHYAATEDRGCLLWRPSIRMPRWFSRIMLEITDIRVERLCSISETDIIAEGCPKEYMLGLNWFKPLWESIYGPGSWDSDPWVWVISFRKI